MWKAKMPCGTAGKWLVINAPEPLFTKVMASNEWHAFPIKRRTSPQLGLALVRGLTAGTGIANVGKADTGWTIRIKLEDLPPEWKEKAPGTLRLTAHADSAIVLLPEMGKGKKEEDTSDLGF